MFPENISQNITFYFPKILTFAALLGIFIIGVGGREERVAALIFHVWVKVKRSLNQTWGSSCVAGREAMFEITLNQNKYQHSALARLNYELLLHI